MNHYEALRILLKWHSEFHKAFTFNKIDELLNKLKNYKTCWRNGETEGTYEYCICENDYTLITISVYNNRYFEFELAKTIGSDKFILSYMEVDALVSLYPNLFSYFDEQFKKQGLKLNV